MKHKAFIYIMIAGILWGSSSIFFNLLKPFGFSPLHMAAMRGSVAALTFVIYALFTDRCLFKVSFKELILYICSGISVYGAGAFYYASIDASSVSTAVILMYTAPVFVTAYSVIFLGESLTLKKCIAIGFVIVGCALVSGLIGGLRFSVAGIILGLAAGISYSAYNIFTKIEMIKKCNSLSATLYCFITVSVVALFGCQPLSLIHIAMQQPLQSLPLILGIGICTSVLPYFLYTLALRDIPAGTASALGVVEPMAATIFSVIFFNEVLNFYSICGIILILIAVLMLREE